MASKGLARFPQILTEEDVIRHYYSDPAAAEPGELAVVADGGDVADTEPPPGEASVPPPSDPSPPDGDADAGDAGKTPSVPPGPEELESKHTKAELIAMAEQAGIDPSGNKADLADRLAAHYASAP